MHRTQRAASAAALGAALALCATACTVITVKPAADPLASLSSGQIAARSYADLIASSSVRMNGSRTSTTPGSFSLELVKSEGCSGTISITGVGTFQILVIRSKVWIKPDAAYWDQQKISTAVLHIVSGKFLQGSPSSTGLGVMSNLCALQAIANDSSAAQRTHATFAGQKALVFHGPDGATVTVSDSAVPEVLQVTHFGSGEGTVDFSDFNAPVTLTPPPADETITNGAYYGM